MSQRLLLSEHRCHAHCLHNTTGRRAREAETLQGVCAYWRYANGLRGPDSRRGCTRGSSETERTKQAYHTIKPSPCSGKRLVLSCSSLPVILLVVIHRYHELLAQGLTWTGYINWCNSLQPQSRLSRSGENPRAAQALLVVGVLICWRR